jgi:curved DNA-binding protein CbpA
MRELKQHPDLGGELWNAMMLNEAYAILSDNNRRAEYDRQLHEWYAKKTISTKSRPLKHPLAVECPSCHRPLAGEAKSGNRCPACKCSGMSGHFEKPLCKEHRRSMTRMRKTGKLEFRSSRARNRKDAEMLDISPGGIRFICREKLRTDSTISIWNSLVRGEAQVVSTQNREVDRGKQMYVIGAQFLNVAFSEIKGSFISTFV